ncbi:MAG: hypothetical protein AVDCRST_MAG96-1505 [uncultured Segetibacter sp.]|uniref:Protein kinase domain-containing protein n=1 Tax=uncultured Segetibacter sp. TaxID=481133 RepID=A0A6J4SG51_9BACT|nr:MAG: hypothetical protein AVDCRST_MAG96-1505 [uncultured Segetibacter sp.]
MAPEQNEGQMFFQTDVYSFGVILFELLAGRVPFPLQDKGETARNAVRLAHMETLPPDVISLRKEALPQTWTEDKKAREMNIPDWLVAAVYKCLRKKPENRFANGKELHEYIIHNSIRTTSQKLQSANVVEDNNVQKLLREKEQLQQQVLQYKQQITIKEKEIHELKAVVDNTNHEREYWYNNTKTTSSSPKKKGISKTAFALLVLLTIGLAALSAYNLFNDNRSGKTELSRTSRNSADTTTASNKPPVKKVSEKKENTAAKKEISPVNTDSVSNPIGESARVKTTENNKENIRKDTPQVKEQAPPQVPSKSPRQYMVTEKAYFYNTPDESTRRNAFVVPANNAILNALDEQNDFILVQFRNQLGQSSKGWLRKKDLQLLNE